MRRLPESYLPLKAPVFPNAPTTLAPEYESLLEAFRNGLRPSTTRIDPCDSNFAFEQKYRLRYTGVLFDTVGYSHMIPLFEDNHRYLTVMAGAQTGKTRLMLAAIVRLCYLYPSSMFGYFFPDFRTGADFSATRFIKYLGSSDTLKATVGKPEEEEDKERESNNVLRRALGGSTVFFLSVTGTATESNPFRGIIFDEVRKMPRGDVERAEQRLSAQAEPYRHAVSTARFPDSDIHKMFLEGDQRWFHTECSCPDGVVLTRNFPNCILDLRKADESARRRARSAFERVGRPYLTGDQIKQWGEAVYVCPRCGDVLPTPNAGWWEPEAEQNWSHSYQLSQILSPVWPAARMLYTYEKSEDVQEFHNSDLGIPFLDPQAQPVHEEHLAACVDMSLTWCAKKTQRDRRRYCIDVAGGMDTMGGYNCLVLKKADERGKFETIHVEVLHGDDPWFEAGVRMMDYDVRILISDAEPHYNEAKRFRDKFKGRVYLCHYGEIQGTKGGAPMVEWGDRRKLPEGQKGEQTIERYSVRINRTKGLQWSLGRWVMRRNVVPDPRQLMQSLPVQREKGMDRVILTPGLRRGTFAPMPVGLDPYFRHQRCVAFVKETGSSEIAQRTRDFKVVAEHVGLDPHFAHADLYANVALARITGRCMDEEE